MDIIGSADLYLRFIIAFAVVVGLIAAAAWIAKYMGFVTPLRRIGKQRRLSVSESIAIDTKRRLLLISVDGMEQLICVGGSNDFVVKNDIIPSIALSDDKIVIFDTKLAEASND